LALPLVYHEAKTRRAWCYVPKEMGNLEERETLAMSMVDELRRQLSPMLKTLNRNLTSEEIATFFSYLESPLLFDDINVMIEELRQGEDSELIEEDPTAQLLAGLEALQDVDSDKKLAVVLKEHSIFASPETPAHLRGLAELAQGHKDDEKAEYFNSLAGMLEQATGRDTETDALIEALAAIAEIDSEEELDSVFLKHPILSKLESIERLRQAAVETDDGNTAQFYLDVADMLEERQASELPPNLDEALQAFVEANSPAEYMAVIELYPVLHSPEAIAHFQQRAVVAAQSEEEDIAEFWENLAETMERIRSLKMDENSIDG